MLKGNLKRVMMIFLLFCLVLTSVLPVSATSAPTLNSDDAAVRAYLEETKMYENAIREMEKYIYVTKAGTLAVSNAFPISLNRSNAIYADLFASLEKTNEMLRSGELKLSDIDLINADDNFDDTKASAPEGCVGSNQIKTKWWGKKFNFDSCKVRNVLQAVAGGLGVGAIIAVVGFGVAWGVVIPILIVEVVIVTALAASGGFDKGMFFALTWVGHHWWGIQ